MKLEDIQYKIKNDKLNFIHMKLIDVTDSEFRRLDEIVASYHDKKDIERNIDKVQSVDQFGFEESEKIEYEGCVPHSFFFRMFGGRDASFDNYQTTIKKQKKKDLNKVSIYTSNPRNESYDLINAIKDEFKPEFTQNTKDVYDQLELTLS